MKNNKNLIIAAVAVVVLLLGVGGYMLFGHKTADPVATQSQFDSEDAIKIPASDIGLTMELSSDKKKVRFNATKLNGVKSLEWTFNYDADIPADQRSEGDGSNKVSQAFGSLEPVDVSGKGTYQSEFRELGTCSSGHCRYDTGVEKVNLVLKMTKTDGKVYQVEDSISL
ncbi:hypothetical protein BH09PAT1_BH09PAT1_3840 [soil metagenome]